MLTAGSDLIGISPHPDDSELGAGATIANHVGPAAIVLVTNGVDSRRIGEAENGAKVLDADLVHLPTLQQETEVAVTASLIDAIAHQLDAHATLLIPPLGDSHQDHDAVARACLAAARRSPVSIVEYETPSAPPGWAPNLYVPVPAVAVEAKVQSIAEHVTQSDRAYVQKNAVVARVMFHGAKVGVPYAEAFRVLRGVA